MPLPMFHGGDELRLQGFPICPGIAIGVPFFFTIYEEKVPEFAVADEEIENEIARFYRALSDSREDLITLQRSLKKEGGMEAVAILNSHLEMISDPLMKSQVEEGIRTKKRNTEYIFKSVAGEYEKRLSDITDLFFRERLKDFQDISRRIISHLGNNKKRSSLRSISSQSIIFAHELYPSDTAEANIDSIEAFVTRSGAETSHVAIMARARGIPFVTSVNFPHLADSLPTEVIVDGNQGVVIINPQSSTKESFRKEKKQFKLPTKNWKSIFKTETKDGFKVRLSANIESVHELDMLSHYGGVGVGLFRTEYLYLAKENFPSEEEQFIVYKSLVEKLNGHPLVIRTFDIGGDKLGSFHLTRYEKNPNLGCRAIRLMLKEKAIFKTQIRAILRASAFGDVSILFPLISCVEEVREAKELVHEMKRHLYAEGIPFARKIPLGCMIEVPSAALSVDILERECDFLSIGTNDLVQYSLAVDRGNPTLSYLYTMGHISLIRLLEMIVKKASIPLSLCGEVAADTKFTPLLIGMGLEEFSLSPPSIPLVSNLIRQITLEETKALADRVLNLTTMEEIRKALTDFRDRLNL